MWRLRCNREKRGRSILKNIWKLLLGAHVAGANNMRPEEGSSGLSRGIGALHSRLTMGESRQGMFSSNARGRNKKMRNAYNGVLKKAGRKKEAEGCLTYSRGAGSGGEQCKMGRSKIEVVVRFHNWWASHFKSKNAAEGWKGEGGVKKNLGKQMSLIGTCGSGYLEHLGA